MRSCAENGTEIPRGTPVSTDYKGRHFGSEFSLHSSFQHQFCVYTKIISTTQC